MKYCQHCGQEVHDEAIVCIHCGRPLNSQNELTNKKSIDKNMPLLNLVSLLIPIVGLCLYLTYVKEKPTCAKGCGIAALTGFILGILLICF